MKVALSAVLLLFVNDIDKTLVRKIVRSHRDEIERCYASGLKANPHLGGRLVVRFSINGKGKVTEAKMIESEMAAPAVEQCITNEIEKWEFPKFGRGDPVTITYPFTFVPPHAQQTRTPEVGDYNLPEQLKPSDIMRGMAAIKPLVAACYAQYKVDGMVNVSVTIANTGRVSKAIITGKFAGTPTGECVARAVEKAIFPTFEGASMSGIDYPFTLGAPRAR
jgi:hypothetical protein